MVVMFVSIGFYLAAGFYLLIFQKATLCQTRSLFSTQLHILKAAYSVESILREFYDNSKNGFSGDNDIGI